MQEPKLLLLDEPSLGLDPKTQQLIFKTIKDINKTGTTIMMVEQNARQALKICSKAYVIEQGCVAAVGRPPRGVAPVVVEVQPAPRPSTPRPTAGRTCAQLEADYTRLTSRTRCRADADCHIVEGQCAHGLGGCSHAVSTSVSGSSLTNLGQAFRQASCGGGACRCARPPSAARCEAGSCVPDSGRRAPAPTRPGPARPVAPQRCPALACGLPSGCRRTTRDENGCPTCNCADDDSQRR